jgi:hypothetical protein
LQRDNEIDLLAILVTPVTQFAAKSLNVDAKVACNHRLKVKSGGVHILQQRTGSDT